MMGGNGQDTTATVQAALAAGNELWAANLYLIGRPEDPRALWLTDWESPLLWPLWGTYQAAVIGRSKITSAVGLESQNLTLNWSPNPSGFTGNIQTTSPYELARLGIYDNWPVRAWRTLMPTPGDANTWGAYELFGGVVGQATVERGRIEFSVESWLYILDQKIPTGVIEATNPLASYTGGTPPAGMSQLPTFTVTGLYANTNTNIAGDCTAPDPGHIFGLNVLANGYLVFNGTSSLAGLYSIIGENSTYEATDHTNHNQFQLMSPLPWAPSPGDTFYVSGASPIDQADGDFFGFPYVPAPEQSA